MRILITGGCGFIGQHLARRLQGHDLVALDALLPQVHADPDNARRAFPGSVVVGDVSDPQAWADLSHGLDAVIHLAAETGTGQSMYEVERYTRVNVEGTRLAGAFAAARGIPVIALSSRAVYGDGAPDRASHEEDAHQPVSVYGETKSAGERALVTAAAAVPVTVIRPQNVIGPGQALHNPYTGVLAAFSAMLREGRPITVYGNGLQTRDFVHVADLADLIVWCLQHPPAPEDPRVLNCGTGERTTLLDLAAYAGEGAATGPTGVQHLDVQRAGDIEHACASLDRLREIGAPLPRWTAREAVIDFVRWSWSQPEVPSAVWDSALDELAARGLAGPGHQGA